MPAKTFAQRWRENPPERAELTMIETRLVQALAKGKSISRTCLMPNIISIHPAPTGDAPHALPHD